MKELRLEEVLHYPFKAVSIALVDKDFKIDFHESQQNIGIEVSDWSPELGIPPSTGGRIAIRTAKYAAPVKGPKIIKKFIGKDHTRCEETQKLQVDQDDLTALLRLSTIFFDIPMADKYALSIAYTLSDAGNGHTRVVVVAEAEFNKKMMKAMIEKQMISACEESLVDWFKALTQRSKIERDKLNHAHRFLTPQQRVSDTAVIGLWQAQAEVLAAESPKASVTHTAEAGSTATATSSHAGEDQGQDGGVASPAPMHGRSRTPPPTRRNTTVSAQVPQVLLDAEDSGIQPVTPIREQHNRPPLRPAPTPSRSAPPPPPPGVTGTSLHDSTAAEAGPQNSPAPKRSAPKPPPSQTNIDNQTLPAEGGQTSTPSRDPTSTEAVPHESQEPHPVKRTEPPIRRLSRMESDIGDVPVPASPARPPPKPVQDKEHPVGRQSVLRPPRTSIPGANTPASEAKARRDPHQRLSNADTAPRSDPVQRRLSVSQRASANRRGSQDTLGPSDSPTVLGRTAVSRSLSAELLNVPAGRQRRASVTARDGYTNAAPARMKSPLGQSVVQKMAGTVPQPGLPKEHTPVSLQLSARHYDPHISSKNGGCFTIHVQTKIACWDVHRTLKEIDSLHRSLAEVVSADTLPFFPPKALFDSNRTDYSNGRLQLIHSYISQLVSHHQKIPSRAVILESGRLDTFLELHRLLPPAHMAS